jgi:RNA polymerase sigma-70 factor, ECF subfamily
VLATLRDDRIQETRWSSLAALVVRAQEGDRDAFGRLVEQFQRTVYAVCLARLGNPSEALELTQEVFLHALRRIDQLREPERFAGWVRQIAVRLAINRATRRPALPSVASQVLEGASAKRDDPLDELISRERAQRLWEGLERLKALDREALVAFYIQGQSLLEIAERLNTPIGTIKRRLHVARKRLRAELEAAAAHADEWSDGPVREPDLEDALEGELAMA